PDGLTDGNGPANLKSKSEILKFLKDSFALGHKAAATLTADNLLQPIGRSKSPRLQLGFFGVAHAYDHSGQMVEYLRMNGVVPPAAHRTDSSAPQPLLHCRAVPRCRGWHVTGANHFIHFEERDSDHPFVEKVWHCHSDRAGIFLSIAAPNFEIAITKLAGHDF